MYGFLSCKRKSLYVIAKYFIIKEVCFSIYQYSFVLFIIFLYFLIYRHFSPFFELRNLVIIMIFYLMNESHHHLQPMIINELSLELLNCLKRLLMVVFRAY